VDVVLVSDRAEGRFRLLWLAAVFEDLGTIDHLPPKLPKSNFILDPNPNTVAMSKLIGGKMQANNQTV